MNDRTIEVQTIRGETILMKVDTYSLHLTLDCLFTSVLLRDIEFEDNCHAISTKNGSFRLMLCDNYTEVKVFLDDHYQDIHEQKGREAMFRHDLNTEAAYPTNVHK